MVYAPERPTETHLDLIDRPVGRSFYDDSAVVYISYRELLPEEHGLMAQCQINGNLHTVLFDARKRNIAYSWQLSSMDASHERTVTNLEVDNNDNVVAWQAQFRTNGSLINVSDLNDWHETWVNIQRVLRSPEAKENATKLFKIRADQEFRLYNFQLNPDVEAIREVNDADFAGDINQALRGENGKILVHHRKRLNDREIWQETEKREFAISKIGFTALYPITRPNTPKSEPYYSQPSILGAQTMVDLIDRTRHS